MTAASNPAPTPAHDDATDAAASALVAFWREAGPSRWFTRDDAFDAQCRERFLDLHMRASRRELEPWLDTATGALALVLLVDQIPRNVFRGSAHVWATDGLARRYADAALARGHDRRVEPELRTFFYLPFVHSEALADHERAQALYAGLDGDDPGRWARHHRGIIERFGRFPHRNALLGRESTAEEQAFIDGGGFSG